MEKLPNTDLLSAALRVLQAHIERQPPDPQDIERLRAVAPLDEQTWEADELASCLINRELQKSKATGA